MAHHIILYLLLHLHHMMEYWALEYLIKKKWMKKKQILKYLLGKKSVATTSGATDDIDAATTSEADELSLGPTSAIVKVNN